MNQNLKSKSSWNNEEKACLFVTKYYKKEIAQTIEYKNILSHKL